jgi:hypothetical protein
MKLRVIYAQINVPYSILNGSTSAVRGQRKQTYKIRQI